MASHPPGKCCTIGVRHVGDPKGKTVTVDKKWKAYVAEPPEGKNHKDCGLLYIPDVLGIWQNSQLMADQFAENGYHCMILDIFNGDALVEGQMNEKGFDFMYWMNNGTDGKNPHTPKEIDEIVLAGIKALQDKGVKKLGALGYCFGAKYVARHYKSGIDVGYMAHPSFVEEDELYSIEGPLSISAAETDSIFPSDKRHQSEDILKKTAKPYQINLYSGVTHGFAVRGEIDKPVQKFAKEQAFVQAVQWFDQWLLNSYKKW